MSITPYIKSQLQYSNRVDLVYGTDMIAIVSKSSREAREEPEFDEECNQTTSFRKTRKASLESMTTSQAFFDCLGEHISHIPMTNGKQVTTSHGEQVLFNPSEKRQSDQLAPCTHEEADTRIFVHVIDAV